MAVNALTGIPFGLAALLAGANMADVPGKGVSSGYDRKYTDKLRGILNGKKIDDQQRKYIEALPKSIRKKIFSDSGMTDFLKPHTEMPDLEAQVVIDRSGKPLVGGSNQSVPAPALVGVEMNPGPTGKELYPQMSKEVYLRLKKSGKLPPVQAAQGKKKKKKQVIAAAPVAAKAALPREIQLERKVAKQWHEALLQPFSKIPPRLGGTRSPTVVVKGYVKWIILASANGATTGPGGVFTTVTTPITDCIFFLSPRVFATSTTGPLIGCVSNNTANQAWNNNNTGTQSVSVQWSNQSALTSVVAVNPGRWLTGGITMRVKCNGTVRQGMIYGGYLPMGATLTTGGLIDPVFQINSFTPAQTLVFPSSKEGDTMSGTVTYYPTTNDSVAMSTYVCLTSGNSLIPAMVPYIAATGLSPDCEIWVEAVSYYEVIPDIATLAYSAGEVGPKCDPMDVLDELPGLGPIGNFKDGLSHVAFNSLDGAQATTLMMQDIVRKRKEERKDEQQPLGSPLMSHGDSLESDSTVIVGSRRGSGIDEKTAMAATVMGTKDLIAPRARWLSK